MRLLAIDASQPRGCVVTYMDGMMRQYELTDENGSELLQSIANDHVYTHVFLGNGPGRMTGLRSSASFVSGLALACNASVYVVPSLLIIATSAYLQHGHELWQVIIDARLGQYYTAEYAFTPEGIKVIVPESLVDSVVVSQHSCSIYSDNMRFKPAVVFESIPWVPALTDYQLWQSCGLLKRVAYEMIPLVYLRNACQ